MKEMKRDETRKEHTLIKVLGITAVALLMLVSIAEAAPFAYITDDYSNVTVVDTATNTVTSIIPVGQYPNGIVVTSDGTKVYVTNCGSNDISVIDTATNTVTATMSLAFSPLGIAVSPDGSKVYVTNDDEDGKLFVINTTTNTVAATVPVGLYPNGIVVTPDGSKVYVSELWTESSRYDRGGSSEVSVVNTTTNTVTARIPVGHEPGALAVNPDGTQVYVTNQGSPIDYVYFPGSVSVINTETDTVTTTLPIGHWPNGIAVTPDGKNVYVANQYIADDWQPDGDWSRGNVFVIGTFVTNVPVGAEPMGVAVTPDGKKVYVTNSLDGTISIIDTVTDTVESTVPLRNGCWEICIGPDRTFMPDPNGWQFQNFKSSDKSTDWFKCVYGVNVDLNNTNSKVTDFYNKFFRYDSQAGNCFGFSATSLLLYNYGLNNVYSYNNNDFFQSIIDAVGGHELFFYDFRPRNVYTMISAYQTIQHDKACFDERDWHRATYNDTTGVFENITTVYDDLKKRLESKDYSVIMSIEMINKINNRTKYIGHVVVPYKIEEEWNGDFAKIYVYDPNHPGDSDQYVMFCLIPGSESVFDYDDLVTNVRLVSLTSLNSISAPPKIPDWATDIVSDSANLCYTDNYGRKLGYYEGEFKDGIPGTSPITFLDGENGNNTTEAYHVPDPSIKMELIGYGTGDSEVSMITPTGLIVANVPDSPTSVDELRIINNGTGIYFNSENGTTPYLSLMVDVETPDVAQVVNASISQIEKNGGINLSNDNGTVITQNNGQPRTISLHLEQTGTNPNSDDSLKNIVIEENSTVYLKPSNWNNITNSEVTIEHDVGNDGTIDYTEIIRPENTPTIPVANFTSNVTEGYVPLDVQFNDTSTGTPTSWQWNFGDGSANSTEQNTTHPFTNVGVYNVTLTVMKDGNNSSITKDITVKAPIGAGPFAYITNYYSNNVSVIDTATDKVVADVNVGNAPFGVAVTPDGTKVYVTNYGSNTTSVIDTATNNVTATVNVGGWPYGVAVNPAGTKVYVANKGSNNVSVIDTATNTVTNTVTVGTAPTGVAVTPDGTKVYVANRIYNGTVSVIDTATNTVIATVNVGNAPDGIAVSLDGTKVYVAHDMNVSVIDTATNNVTATVLVGSEPEGIAVSLDGTKVYVANFASHTVSVIDTATNTVTATVRVGSSPRGVAVTPDGTKVYVTNYGGKTVSVIDTTTNTVIATVNVGTSPAAFGQFIVSPPVANFTSNVTEGYAPLSVQFNDTSTGTPTSWEWNFGDGSDDSTEQNTTHTFADVGVYHVTLTVMKYGSNSTITKDITVSLSDAISPVIESVVLFPTNTTTGSTISVTVKATDNIGVTSVNANDIPLINQGGSIWNGSLIALESIHFVNVSAEDAAHNIAWNNSTSYTAVTPDILPPSSITNLRSTNGTTWINWTWQNPADIDFDHVEIYLDGIFQINTSAENFNATYLEPDTSYTIGTRTVDSSGNVNETWVNSSAKTKPLQDTISPVIESVVLFPTSTTTGSKISVTVDVTDNVGVSSVAASGVSLVNTGGNVWEGSIVAEEGTHKVFVIASDASGNTAVDKSATYTATTPDTESPVINSVSLRNRTPDTGDSIVVTVDVTDNVGVRSVSASGVSLAKTGGNFWEGSIVAEEGTHKVLVTASDASGNTAVDKSARYTATTPDTEAPVINSVSLRSSKPDTGDSIVVTVDVTDNVGVRSVSASGVSLAKTGGNVWEGSIVAEEGTHTVSVTASDASGNTAVDKSARYTVTTPDTEAPVINSVSLSSSTPDTGDSIVVTVDVTDNVGVRSVAASGVALVNTGGNVWEGSIVAEEGTHTVSVTTVDEAGNVALDNSTSYTALTPYNLLHSSITNLQSTTGNNWVNWTWQNPLDVDFNHTEIYLDGIFQTSTSAEYFNATGLEPETSYTIGTRTVDINGNVNETWVNATAITKEKDSSVISDPGSDGSSSSVSGSSGNGCGTCSLEPAKNVEVKELSQQFITNGKHVKFLFPKNVTCITYVELDPKRTLGKITTIVEMLKGKSAIVSELPEGKVYKNMNIWVGNKETASPKNIENTVVGFKVEKSWVAGGVDESSIALYRYSDKAWGELVTRKVGEDDKYLYFEAETPGFSPFSIVAPGVDTLNEKEENKSPSSVEGSYIENIGMDGNQSSESGITGLESAEKGSETGSKSKILISIGLLSISLLVGYMVLRKQN